jgi:hypothetical protein
MVNTKSAVTHCSNPLIRMADAEFPDSESQSSCVGEYRKIQAQRNNSHGMQRSPGIVVVHA